jgi:membrane AbrB-like protein
MHLEKYFLLILAGTGGGLIAERCNVPGGAVVGAMLCSGVMALLLPNGISLPPKVATGVQILLGISLGLTFDRSFLAIGAKALPLAILSTVVLLLVAIGMAYLASRLGLVDFGTALFGFSPGGMTGMAILAQAEGQKGAIVAFFHLVRIFILFLTVPLLVRIFLYLHQKP